MIPATPLQSRYLSAIRDLTRDGIPPSYSELQTALGVSNRGQVHRTLHAMRDRGLIHFEDRQKRSLRILGEFQTLGRLTNAELVTLNSRVRRLLHERGL